MSILPFLLLLCCLTRVSAFSWAFASTRKLNGNHFSRVERQNQISRKMSSEDTELPGENAPPAIGLGFGTLCVHAGYECEEGGVSQPVIPPISLSTTFVQTYPGLRPGKEDLSSHGLGYFYSRAANPTRGSLERAIASLENAKHCLTFSSGMASIASIITMLDSGDHVVALNDLYGGTTAYFREVATPRSGINFTYLDFDDHAKVEEVVASVGAKLIWLESPTNPLLKTTDIRALAAIAKKYNCLLAVDSTFQSPYLQNPLELGADIVMHSVTKFLAGHSDVLMGAVAMNSDEIFGKLRLIQERVGSVPSPFECYLTIRGIKTLHLRMEQTMKNAMAVALMLQDHPVVEKVVYPGLESYQYYELARSQTRGAGGVIALYIKGGLPVAAKFLRGLKIVALAVSLGAVESLACSPAIMTHGAVPLEQRLAIGLTDSLIRLSLGIEHTQDVVDDIKNALDACIEDIEISS